ncbi:MULTISPECIES: SAM-dependent methyltransferase [Sorangium]|uniref:Methyltransferase n=2 Tax=Sorangium cellulosum TaxID=56 RepID=A9EW76_SORC5|nr:class I SAM-dependent methyltransferase [Sorangium cellulosum]AAY89054.1 methyltransferase [Sorangium cellulosum]CAN94295.1 Methyltransferase [Sorangium cellulosum So ce56]
MTEFLPGQGTQSHWRTQIHNQLRLLSLLVLPSKNRAHILYEIMSTGNLLNEKSLFLNYGYWRDSPETLDAACEAMAKLVAETARVSRGDRVLDVGFGFGDQDMYWMKHFEPRQIVGLNVTEMQVDIARRRVAERGLSDRIDLRVGSATEIGFEPASFDKVLAVECAFHFQTRERFLEEAFRVLRPGGRIAMADMTVFPFEGPPTVATKLSHFMVRSLQQICKENMVSRHVLRDMMTRIGFQDVEITVIHDDVVMPFSRYIVKRVQDDEIKRRLPAFSRALTLKGAQVTLEGKHPERGLEYVLISATKPLAAA